MPWGQPCMPWGQPVQYVPWQVSPGALHGLCALVAVSTLPPGGPGRQLALLGCAGVSSTTVPNLEVWAPKTLCLHGLSSWVTVFPIRVQRFQLRGAAGQAPSVPQ